MNGNIHRVGFLRVPKDLSTLPAFRFGKKRFVTPKTIDLSDFNLRPKDQLDKPYCAGFAAATYVENLLWRKTAIPKTIDPVPIYERAKQLDGMPDEDGTTLTAALQAVLDLGYFDKNDCSIKVLRDIDQLKRCIHRYGCALIGVMVTKEYYSCNKNNQAVMGTGDQTVLGGHRLMSCGHLREGVICRNSWGEEYGYYGDFIITWEKLAEQFVYGATLDNPMHDFHM